MTITGENPTLLMWYGATVGFCGLVIFSLCIRGWVYSTIEWFTIGRRRCPDCRHTANYHMRSKPENAPDSLMTCSHTEPSIHQNDNGYIYPVRIRCGCKLDRTLIYFNQHMLPEGQSVITQSNRSVLSMTEDELRLAASNRS